MIGALPDVQVPRAVARAAAVVREREADVVRAKEAVEQATRAIGEAISADRRALADALDADRDDPGTEHEHAARADLAETERQLQAQELRLERARDALDAALSESIEKWETAITKSLADSERDVLRLVDELRVAELERARRRVALTWTQRYRQGEKLPSLDFVPPTASTLVRNAKASPHERHSIVDLLDAIRAGVEQATLASEEARRVELDEATASQPSSLHAA